ncbi:MAG TPA: hypothetical protein VGC66_02760 [Pyrinomonadaceae bacterium]|jgi:hypothetical protein
MSPLTDPRLHVTSKLMQDYRIASPVTGESEIASLINVNGKLMLFSIGSDGNVYFIFPDSGSSTGWSQESLNFQPGGAKANLLAAGTEQNGTIQVFVCDTNNVMQVCPVSIGSVSTGDMKRDTYLIGQWTPLPPQSFIQNRTQVINQIEIGYDKDKNLLLTVSITLDGLSDLYSIDYKSPGNPWQRIGYPIAGDDRYTTYKNMSDCKIAINPPPYIPVGLNGVSVYQAADCIDTPEHTTAVYLNNLRISNWPGGMEDKASLEYPPTGQHEITFWRISFIPDTPAGATGGVCAIQLPDSTQASERTLVYCPIPRNASNRVVQIGNDMKFQSLVASRDASGLAEVFALTASNTLFHVRQDPGNTASSHAGWQDGVVIMSNPQITKISLTRNHDGISHLFAVAVDGTLYHIWQDKDSTDWNIVEIELAATGPQSVEQFSSYWTEITVYDSEKAAAANRQVKIFSDNEVVLSINGMTVLVDKDTPWVGISNASGQVVVSMKTNSLGAHALTVWTEFMPETDRVAIDPSGYIQTRLENLQKDAGDTTQAADTLLNAVITDDKGNETHLLKEGTGNRNEQVSNALVDAIHQAMSLHPTPQTATAETAKFFHPKTNMKVARYVPDHDGTYPNLIDTAAVAEQHWHIGCSSGKPVFRTLSRDEAAELIGARQQARSASTAKGFGLPDIDLDWGDIVDAVEEGVATVASDVRDIVVSTIIDPVTQLVTEISAQITLVINSIEYVWNGAIKFVEQAYDMVVMVFNMVGIAFDDLFRWLGSIFNWPDIIRTKNAVKHCVNQSFGVLQGVLEYIQSHADTFFEKLRTDTDAALGNLISSQIGGESLLALQSEGEQRMPAGADESATGNVFSSGFTNNMGGSSAPKVYGVVASGPFQNLIDHLTQYTTQFQNQPAFPAALNYFQDAATKLETNPDYALKLTVAGLLTTLRGLAGLGIQLIRQLVNDLLDAFSAIVDAIGRALNAEWDIPFVTDLYSYVSEGSPLTALDLTSLIIAIPTTALYKITYKRAPFPSEAAVEQFKSTLTAQAMLRAAGLNPASNSPVPRSKDEKPLSEGMKDYLGFTSFLILFSYFTYAGATAIADFQMFSKEDAPATKIEAACSLVAIIAEGVILMLNFPWFFNIEPPEFTTPTRANNAVWLFLTVAFITDSAVFLFTMSKSGERFMGKKASLFGNIGVGINMVLGVAYISVFALLAKIQSDYHEDNPGVTTANMMSAVPLFFKFLRISAWANNKKCQGALAGADLSCNVLAGVLYAMDIIGKIEPSAQLPSDAA